MTNKRVLFICGSMNQTSQLYQVARELARDGRHDLAFTPFYGDRIVDAMRRLGLIEFTIGGNKRRGACLAYLREQGLRVDMHGREGRYDLVVTCTDLVVPKNVRSSRVLVVQEGILDPEGPLFRLVARFPRTLPLWFAGTAATGMSGRYDRFCVASDGYKELFVRHGAEPERVIVTGMPNFDACERYRANRFPHQGFVLVCTSDTRETFKRDSRRELLERAGRIAAGRQLIFKLHPNEDAGRSTREIRQVLPHALVYASGSAEEMIANCAVLVTEWSSTAFVGLALGKEVYSNFGVDELRRLMPVQNGGSAARNIARVCRELLAAGGAKPIPLRRRHVEKRIESRLEKAVNQ